MPYTITIVEITKRLIDAYGKNVYHPTSTVCYGIHQFAEVICVRHDNKFLMYIGDFPRLIPKCPRCMDEKKRL